MKSETGSINVTVNGQVVRKVPAEFIPVPFGRGAPIGMANDGTLYAGFATESPGLESVLLVSDDGGRQWSQKRLDWWQFLDTQVQSDRRPPRFQFWDDRWAMRNDSFGVLADGTLLWAFLKKGDTFGSSGQAESYVIRSEDQGDSWEGPVKIDRSPFPSVGGTSNRMTELADGTVLWPQRLGLTHNELEKIIAEVQRAGRPYEGVPFGRCYVFRSTDGGRTWGDRTPLPESCWEVTISQMRSGRLMAALRHQFIPDLKKESKRVCLADSDDNGRTWTDFRPVRATPNGPTLLEYGQAHGELSELSDGTLVLTHDHRYPYTEQQVLGRISRDQGQTWNEQVYHLTLAGGTILGSTERGVGSGYASSVVLEDDTIVTMTGAGMCVRWRVE